MYNVASLQRLNGGWEHLLKRQFKVFASLWHTPWSPPTNLFISTHKHDHLLPGMAKSLPEMISLGRGTTNDFAYFFIRPATHPRPSLEELSFLDDCIWAQAPCRFVVALRRDISSLWNTWIDTWIDRGRATIFCETSHLRLRTYGLHKETWASVNAP